MGLAATQTRFLSLTARKSNVEYKGQQINQQRSVLSNKSANLYSEMLTLSVPVPPSTAQFTTIQYIFTSGDSNNVGPRYQTIDANDTTKNGIGVLIKNLSKESEILTANLYGQNEYGRYTTLKITDADGNTQNVAYKLTPIEITDNTKYEDAYNQYLYKQYLYEQEMEAINAKTSIIQQQDKALELQLNQLDTEQNEIKTEMDALDKVLGDNVESSFKTFGG